MSLRSFVIGGAGFIGSHLVDRLVADGPVTVFDDLSVGKREYLAEHLADEDTPLQLIEGDVCDLEALSRALASTAPGCDKAGHDVVYHLAANPEARWGLEQTDRDLRQGTMATYNVLEAMRRRDVKKVVFASSGTVYGETTKMCREGDLGNLPISLYGASKLAGEALISAYVECFGLRGWIFRFGNVVGPRGTHGCMLDFLKKLKDNPQELEVLGDGKQAKPYLHVDDCVAGMLHGFAHARGPLNVFNLAPADTSTVAFIAKACVAASPSPKAKIRYTGGDRGWPGDVPRSRLAPGKLAELGFAVQRSSDEAVTAAVAELAREVFG